MSASRFLITGGAGFIGAHAAASMAASGKEVIVTSRRAIASPAGVSRVVPCDLLAPETPAMLACLKADTLVHFAWETTHGQFWNAPSNLDWVAATLKLARGFREAGGRRFIGIGTCFEYDMGGLEPIDEITGALAPKILYGVAKNATRAILESYAQSSGMEFAWARVFHLFGPDEKPTRLVPAVINALLRGEEARTTEGTQPRNFIHSADAGRAIAAVALSGLAGPVNIGSYQHTCVADVAREIARQIGRPDLLRIGALPTKADEPASLVPKLDRLAALGFTPTFDLSSGLADVIQALKRNA